jgi:hypothetical protein
MIRSVVQVEIVNNWWDELLPIAAILISLGTLAYTLWIRYSDNARLEVSATSFVASGPLGDGWYVAVEATNTGRVGATIVQTVRFKLPNGKYLNAWESAMPTVTLPKTMNPGESMTYVFNKEELAAQLVQHECPPEKAVPQVVTGHKTYNGEWNSAGLKVLRAAHKAAVQSEAK